MRSGRIWVLALLNLALAGCGSALAGPQSLQDTLKQSAAQLNGQAQAPDLFGAEFKGTKVSARVEGRDTLVVRFNNAPVDNATFDPLAIQKVLRPKVCELGQLRRVIDSGGRLKLEMVSQIGKSFPAVLFSRC